MLSDALAEGACYMRRSLGVAIGNATLRPTVVRVSVFLVDGSASFCEVGR